ncbi:phosphatidylinositol 3 protein [Rutstroemia sp. NJR-2017a WRK4]|nr:phosphatidylinositol 3 protein [Rutstroemia sp. NJR-2017a WRK4]
MALEEFILDLCEESVNAALLVRRMRAQGDWNKQLMKTADVLVAPDTSQRSRLESEIRSFPDMYNQVQHIVFGLSESGRTEKISENVLPVTVLASFVLASVAAPFLPKWAGPLAIAQARRPRPQITNDTISESNQVQPQKIVRSNTTTPGSTRTRKAKEAASRNAGASGGSADTLSADSSPTMPRSNSLTRPSSAKSTRKLPMELRRPIHLDLKAADGRNLSSASLPELRSPGISSRPATPVTAGLPSRMTEPINKRNSPRSHSTKLLTPASLTSKQKVKLLRQNYFRCESQFLTALEDISNRLVIVPKPARLSALRAELALIAQDLPAEVDIPVICPATLVDGIPSKSRHHRIVRLNPAEATVLNSAEKVPYLLMVEVLRDDFSFEPDTVENERLISRLISEQGSHRRRIFDISESARPHSTNGIRSPGTTDSVFEPTSGDLGSSSLIKATDERSPKPNTKENKAPPPQPIRIPSGGTISSIVSALPTPGTSGTGTETSRSTSPTPKRKMTFPGAGRSGAPDQPDFSALATHMRTASQMLAQLESTSGKRPRGEVAAIRARIIASMQSLEEQSFELEPVANPQTFDIIMANANAVAANTAPEDIEDETPPDAAINTGAGAARMENDQKTSGVQRKGDRDDPSAATFGEAWNVKKERIRKSSPYGWMKNWDVLSVIVKTGADLRQEAFACQLIQVCDKIWQDAGTPVWVKRMRILVTGESSGLIETITNGVSLHSLKRSLTLSTIEAGKNPRGRIATLRDHFVKTFGPPESDAYKAAEDAFKRSLAAYSIISYILQLKDRHNGNVLIDNEGHIIHIDFGFMLSNSPGSVGFEAAPFKLTQDYVDVLGGVGSQAFDDYKKLCKQAFQALRKSADNLIDLVSLMGKESKMPCFTYGVAQATNSLRQRFQLQMSADEAEQFVETDLIGKSLGSYYTRL